MATISVPPRLMLVAACVDAGAAPVAPATVLPPGATVAFDPDLSSLPHAATESVIAMAIASAHHRFPNIAPLPCRVCITAPANRCAGFPKLYPLRVAQLR